MYSFSGNSAAPDLYSPSIGPHISSSRIGRPIMGIYKSLTEAWMWKLGLRPQNSFSGNICFKISVFCLCSVATDAYRAAEHPRPLPWDDLSCTRLWSSLWVVAFPMAPLPIILDWFLIWVAYKFAVLGGFTRSIAYCHLYGGGLLAIGLCLICIACRFAVGGLMIHKEYCLLYYHTTSNRKRGSADKAIGLQS